MRTLLAVFLIFGFLSSAMAQSGIPGAAQPMVPNSSGSGGGGITTITAGTTPTSGFSAGQFLYSDGSHVQAGSFGSSLLFSGGNLNVPNYISAASTLASMSTVGGL